MLCCRTARGAEYRVCVLEANNCFFVPRSRQVAPLNVKFGSEEISFLSVLGHL